MYLLAVAVYFLCTYAEHALAAAGTCTLPGLGLHFYNWDGLQTCSPASWVTPSNEEEVSEYLRKTEGPVKVVGGGLSFSGIQLVEDGGHMMSLDRMNQILQVERLPGSEGALVTVQAGIRLRDLAEKLDALGLAMPNMGATAQQSFAGAAATGTHGTGQRLGGIATQAVALRLATSDGTVVSASAGQNDSVFRAARTGLGALGVLTSVTLRTVPQWKMQLEQYATSLHALLTELPQLLIQHPRLQWSWTPYTDNATVVIRTDVPWSTPISPSGDSDNTGCWVTGAMPNPCTDISYKTLTDSAYHYAKRTKYTEMEMFIPVELSVEAVRAFVEWMDQPEVRAQRNDAVQISAMLRYVAADDITLSPMHGRDTAVLSFIAVQAEGSTQQFELYAGGLQALCEERFHGRPHWGKVSYVDSNTKTYLASAYPGMQEFLSLARALDRPRRFSNSFLHDRLGL